MLDTLSACFPLLREKYPLILSVAALGRFEGDFALRFVVPVEPEVG